MPDYRVMFDSDWTRAWDLGGKERTVTILKVEAGTLADPRRPNKKDRKPVLTLKGWPKPLALNKINSRTIAGLYGNMTEAWVGKRVTLYVTQTRDPQTGGDCDCIRINNVEPKVQGEPAPVVAAPPAQPADREAGAEG